MTEITLVRHGETNYNARGLIQGASSDIPLNETGQEQAAQLRSHLDMSRYDRIISSDLLRAFSTARILNKEANLPIEQDDRLRELNPGDWDGKAVAPLKKEFPGAFDDLGFLTPDYATVANGETFPAVRDRLLDGAKSYIEKYPDGHLLFVSHGFAIRALVAELLHLADLYQLAQMQNTGVARVVVHPDDLLTRLVFYNRGFSNQII
ncbi:histidine phosphatase family protein [Schleiferilactobacillus harbinensis]|uniref:histidine phosphatase family protein n=1 Tax=Schleiferilactobacillus harbinensis TaxID=304207 RepID=UPI0012399AF4|nr:histidine phosphatase family protein [Schleiferilactobacillus harbinensis]QEU48649.1 histidine phosphatase family protein [Schleiferilactobacillus harbinensis]